MKARRQSVLYDLVSQGHVTSQQEAVRLLSERGMAATQATVSRDLDEIGAVRVREGNNIRYAPGDTRSGYGASLTQVLRDYVTDILVSGSMAVLRTPPGHAGVVAAAIDRSQLDGVLGSIAGDDTVFIVADEQRGGTGVKTLLEEIAQSAD